MIFGKLELKKIKVKIKKSSNINHHKRFSFKMSFQQMQTYLLQLSNLFS